MLTEELSPKMTLEVASGLFELYLTLADLQRFWDSIPGRWVPRPYLLQTDFWMRAPGPVRGGSPGAMSLERAG